MTSNSSKDHSTRVNDTTKVGVPGETLPPKSGTHQEKVIRRKEHLEEMGQALQEGRLPTTNQINQGLDKLTANNNLHGLASDMSPEGKRMMANAERLVESTQLLLAEKNDNDQLQNIVYHSGQAGQNMKGGDDINGVKSELAGAAGDTKNLAVDGAESISRVAWLIVTSSQFRRLINDVTNILQETVTSNVPGHPGQSGETTIDPRTGHSTYPNTNDIQAGNNDGVYPQTQGIHTGNHEGTYPHTQDIHTQSQDIVHPHTQGIHTGNQDGAYPNTHATSFEKRDRSSMDNTVPSAQSNLTGNTIRNEGLTHSSAGSHIEPSMSDPSYHPHDLTQAQGVPDSVHHGQDREMTPEEARDNLRSTLKDTMAPAYFNTKEAARPYVHKAEQGEISPLDAAVGVAKEMHSGLQQKVANMQLSPDQRTHLMQRVKAIFREVQGNPDFQTAVDELLSIFSTLKDHGRHATNTVSETAAAKHEVAEDDVSVARENARELVENFAGQKSLDPLLMAFRDLSNKVDEDPHLGEFLQDIKTFVHRSIREYDYVDRPGYTDDANRIVERGHAIMEGKYRGLFTRITDELSNFNLALKSDKTTKRFVRDLEAFARDLFLDESGNPTFKYDLVKDFAKLIPVIAEKMDYVPLPRVEQSDEKMDVVLDNVVIQCSNILPNFVHIKTDTVVDTNLHAEQNVRNKVYVKLSHVQVKVKDAAFYYRMKTFPKMTDVGYIDVEMPEDGIELDLLLNTNPAKGKKAHLYEVLDCNTRVNDLKLKIHGSKHSTRYKLLAPFINSKVKKIIEQMVPQKLTEMLVDIDNRIALATEQTLMNIERKNAESKVNPSPMKPSKTDHTTEWSSDAYNPQQSAHLTHGTDKMTKI
ncbi:hypothetical protein K7432_000758 [Basidiobolus ranarum]|uniref:HAM1-like N-terminal domain-containing protein n=1 Tax=Basidiobolus ranarum TaxID=34480 RepID=A0ABR2X463_9FUNG